MNPNKNIKIMPFTEANFENAIIELFRDQLGYDYLYGPDVVHDYTQPLHLEQLWALLHHQINFRLFKVMIDLILKSMMEHLLNIENCFSSQISDTLLPKLMSEELSVKHIAQQ
jgi:hypothetical protein